MFIDRYDAGIQLAKELISFQGTNPVVLAIPKDGVPVGFEVAKRIDAKFSLVILRNLPFPNHPMSSFGAIAEDDSIFFLPGAAMNLTSQQIKTIVKEQRKEIIRSKKVMRSDQPLPNIKDEDVILVNDGIAIGALMYAAINLCKKLNPAKIVVAAPVSSPEVARSLDQMSSVNNAIILKQPKFFRSVSQVYDRWQPVSDHEVLSIMERFHNQSS